MHIILKNSLAKFFEKNPEATEAYVSLGKPFFDKEAAERFLRGVWGEHVKTYTKAQFDAATKPEEADDSVKETPVGEEVTSEEVSAPEQSAASTEETAPEEVIAPPAQGENTNSEEVRPPVAQKAKSGKNQRKESVKMK